MGCGYFYSSSSSSAPAFLLLLLLLGLTQPETHDNRGPRRKKDKSIINRVYPEILFSHVIVESAQTQSGRPSTRSRGGFPVTIIFFSTIRPVGRAERCVSRKRHARESSGESSLILLEPRSSHSRRRLNRENRNASSAESITAARSRYAAARFVNLDRISAEFQQPTLANRDSPPANVRTIYKVPQFLRNIARLSRAFQILRARARALLSPESRSVAAKKHGPPIYPRFLSVLSSSSSVAQMNRDRILPL